MQERSRTNSTTSRRNERQRRDARALEVNATFSLRTFPRSGDVCRWTAIIFNNQANLFAFQQFIEFFHEHDELRVVMFKLNQVHEFQRPLPFLWIHGC